MQAGGRRNGRVHGWWDTVDFVATKFLGALLHGGGSHFSPAREERAKIARRLVGDADKWVRRCALLFQLHYGKETDRSLLFELIGRVEAEDEFFIQKAIGWALRQISRQHPEAVRTFVAEHSAVLSTLAQREALRLLPQEPGGWRRRPAVAAGAAAAAARLAESDHCRRPSRRQGGWNQRQPSKTSMKKSTLGSSTSGRSAMITRKTMDSSTEAPCST